MNDLLYSVGLDVTDLKTSARVAKEQADEIKRGFKGFKDVLEFGGVGAVVFSFFRSVIDYAKNMKGPLDENTAAVRRFGESLTEGNQSLLGLGAQALGFVNRVGERIGFWMRAGIDGLGTVMAVERQEKEQAIERQRIEEEKARHGAEYKKVTEDILALEKEATKIAYQQLTAQEQFNASAQKYQEITSQLENFSGTQIERRRLELQLQQASVDVLKADAELKKEEAEAQKKRDAEAQKVAEQHIAQQEKLLKLRFDALTSEEKIAALDRTRVQLIDAIARLKQEGKDTTAAEISLLETTNELEKLHTAELEKQVRIRRADEEAARRARAQEAQERAGGAIIGSAVRSGMDFQYSDDAALQELVRRNRQRATEMRNNNPQNFYEIRLEAGRLEAEANNAEAELRLRSRVRGAFQRGGASAVYSSFPDLDPLVIDRLIAQFAQQQGTNKETLDTLKTIEERLSAVFPRRAPSR